MPCLQWGVLKRKMLCTCWLSKPKRKVMPGTEAEKNVGLRGIDAKKVCANDDIDNICVFRMRWKKHKAGQYQDGVCVFYCLASPGVVYRTLDIGLGHFFFISLSINFVRVFCLHICLHTVCLQYHRIQKRAVYSLELELSWLLVARNQASSFSFY